jgi:hypothetical protein
MVDRAPKDAKQSAAHLVPKRTPTQGNWLPFEGAHTAVPELTATKEPLRGD